MKIRISLFLFIIFSFPLFAKNVSNGVINFDFASEGQKIIQLNGDWEFYKGQVFSTLANAQLKIDFMQVPGIWKSASSNKNNAEYGCNTYRVLISGLRPDSEYGIFSRSSPAHSARIFSNGTFIKEYGTFSRHAKDYKPFRLPMLCQIWSDKKGCIELVIQVANFTNTRTGGITSPIMFGHLKDIRSLYISFLVVVSIILGSLIFLVITHFLIWLFDRGHIRGLCFSIYLIFLYCKIVDCSIGLFFPSFDYHIQMRMQNLVLLGFGLFAFLYRYDNFFVIKHPHIDKVCSFAALILGLIYFCVPIWIFSYIVSFLTLLSMIYFVYSLFRMVFAIKVRNYYVVVYTCSYWVSFVGIFLDTFFYGSLPYRFLTYTEISTVLLILISVVYLAIYLEILMQIYLKKKNTLSEHYAAYRKFVPSELPHIFNKENFGKIALGDYAEIDSVIMVIGEEVRSYEKIQIGLREQFETFGFYSTKIVELVEQAGGTVLSIAGSSITALFNKGAKNAIDVAVEIQSLLQVMNERRIQDYYPYVCFNISVHCGPILIGVIGGERRIDYTVISHNIELADNICTLGYYKNIQIIISEPVVQMLEESDKAKLKPLGKIKFRELSYPINLYGLASKGEMESSSDSEGQYAITQRDADKYIDI